jgi:hypothetical protein
VFKVIDKDQKEFVVPAAYTFLSLLDSNGDYITGLAVSLTDGNFYLHFPGSEVKLRPLTHLTGDLSVTLPDVLHKPLEPIVAIDTTTEVRR